MSEKIKVKDGKVFLMSDKSHTREDEPLASIEDTGNGYQFISYSWTLSDHDHHHTLGYCDADYLAKLLDVVGE